MLDGDAFVFPNDNGIRPSCGLKVRDHVAIEALKGILAAGNVSFYETDRLPVITDAAYVLADLMIARSQE